jgi:hypothetical protein
MRGWGTARQFCLHGVRVRGARANGLPERDVSKRGVVML